MMSSTTAAPQTNREEGQASSKEDQLFAQDARFSCNICFEPVSEPVVTRCGHLYCWPCLYRWLSPGMTNEERASLGMPRLRAPLDQSRRVCPVCKSESSVPTLVPIYVRNVDKEEAIERRPAEDKPIPKTTSDVSDLNSLGLDIDEDPIDLTLDIDYEVLQPPDIPTTVTADGGLRQRRRNESRDESDDTVPTRPVPSRERAATDISGPMVRTSDLPNHHARATLSYGLVLAMHQTLLNATNSTDAANNHHQEETIPSLHYPQQRRDTHPSDDVDWDQDPASTVFLSRLLLGLSLFVLFCLLSF